VFGVKYTNGSPITNICLHSGLNVCLDWNLEAGQDSL